MQDEKTNKNADVTRDELDAISRVQTALSEMSLTAAVLAWRLRALFAAHHSQRHLILAATLLDDVGNDLHDALREVRGVVGCWSFSDERPTVVLRPPTR
jgi:hypothetical protein